MAEMTFSLKDLTPGERSQVTGLRRTVSDIADKLGIVRQKVADIAPKVLKLFNELSAKHDNLGGFVGFARLFDPNMPTHAADKDGTPGYRNNKMYQALDYMRRTQRLTNRPRGQQGRRDPATDQLARTLATVLQIVKHDEVIWQAVQKEFRFGDRSLARLKTRVAEVKPIVDFSDVKKIDVTADEVIHMEPVRPATTAPSIDVEAVASKVIKRQPRKVAA